MIKELRFKGLLKPIQSALAALPEHQRGKNIQYTLLDAGMSAFSVFYMQSPSFLSWQQDMERKTDRNNAKSLFGIKGIPCDEQVKNLLDPVSPEALNAPFWSLYHTLDAGGQLDVYRGVGGTYMVSVDGTCHHGSRKIHCEQCRVTLYGENAYLHPSAVIGDVECARSSTGAEFGSRIHDAAGWS